MKQIERKRDYSLMHTKQCSKCKETKSLDQFYKNKDGKYGLRSNCKECSNKINTEYYTNNRDRLKKYYRENNKEYIKVKSLNI
jgi:hypothetical protein